MRLGFIKTAAAIPNVRVGDCEFNVLQTQHLLTAAAKAGAEIVVFAELGITGYTCGDLFRQNLLIEEAEKALKVLLQKTAAVAALGVVGLPVQVKNTVYNCAVVFQKGKILGVVPKSFGSGEESQAQMRWFADGRNVCGKEIVLAGQEVPFGTDLLFSAQEVVVSVQLGQNLFTPVPPTAKACLGGANLILNLSADYEEAGKNIRLQQAIAQESARCSCGYVYASAGFGESSTDLVYGSNAFIFEGGELLAHSKRFEIKEQIVLAEIDVELLLAQRRLSGAFDTESESAAYRNLPFEVKKNSLSGFSRAVKAEPFFPTEKKEDYCEEILSIQAQGLMQRLQHTRCQKAVIGISGGLDSTLALLVAVRAFDALGLDRKGIIGVTMPCFGTTDRTYQNALSLMKRLKITLREVDIKAACEQHLKDLKHSLGKKDATYENAQARERTQVLMDMANQEGALVVGTGDLSELALGWATYNGDHMSMYGVNGGIVKTLVRRLVDYEAQKCVEAKLACTLRDVLDTPVSPELLPPDHQKISQKTEDLVGPYELHDFFIYYFLRYGFSAEKIYFLALKAFDGKYKSAEIKKWLGVFVKRFFAQQFKRSCMPDGPKALCVGLSPRGSWLMPSDAQANLWLKECENL